MICVNDEQIGMKKNCILILAVLRQQVSLKSGTYFEQMPYFETIQLLVDPKV